MNARLVKTSEMLPEVKKCVPVCARVLLRVSVIVGGCMCVRVGARAHVWVYVCGVVVGVRFCQPGWIRCVSADWDI